MNEAENELRQNVVLENESVGHDRLGKTEGAMSSDSVSETWVAQTNEDASYFSPDSVIKRGFFKNILASRWVVSLLKNESYKTFLEAGCYKCLSRFDLGEKMLRATWHLDKKHS